MKAKRLTALALAALMTASGTSVAFAKEYANSDYDLDFVSSSGDYYYGYDEDENAIIKKKPSEFQPGDTIYIPLLEDSSEKFNNSRGKNFTVYIDGNKFDVGDSYVDDVGVVRKRGYFGTTTPDVVKYSTKGFSNSDYNGISFVPKSSSDADVKEAAIAAIKNSAAYQAVLNSTKNQYKVTTGWLVNGTYTTVDPTIDPNNDDLKKAGFTQVVFYSHGGMQSKNLSDLGLTAIDVGSGLVKDGKTFYSNNQAGTDFLGSSFVQYEKKVNLYVKLEDKTAQYGTFYVDSDGEKPIEYSENLINETATIYVNNNVTPKKFIYADVSKQIDALNAVTGAKWEKADSYAKDYAYDSNKNLVQISTITENGWEKDEKLYTTDEALAEVKKVTPYADAEIISITPGNPKYIYNGREMTDSDVSKIVDSEINAMSVSANVNKEVIKGTTTYSRELGYWAYIDTKKSTTTKDIDIVGKIYVGTSKSDAEDETGFYVDVTLTNKDVGNSTFVDVDSDAYIEPGQRAVLSFADDADDVVIEFGDDAWYEFNARGQGRVNFAYNTNFDRDFAYDYDHANIDFINFVAEPTTNKTGTLYIYADEDSYIYEVTSKGAKKINGAYYDDDEGAWVIRTRHLTSYAISDRRLKTIDQMEDDKNSSSSSKPSGSQGSGSGNGNYKPIPDTGR